MTPLPFRKTPTEIMRIIRLFHQNHLSYNLFKCEHIFEGAHKNLDILFEKFSDYRSASKLLEKEGYVLYLPESVEKYKKMYILFRAGIVTRIHLHRAVAWHGLCVLDKKFIFSHARMPAPSIFVPSPEDQLLIHVAHVVFENLEISDMAARLIRDLVHSPLDWHYLHGILKKEKWRQPFDHVVSSVRANTQPQKNQLILHFVKKAAMTPSSWLTLVKKGFSIFFRKMSLHRKGCLIALVGVNGSGKTTLMRKLLTAYFPLSRTVNGQSGYYFGWVPFSPVSKIVSHQFKKKGRSVFKEMNVEGRRKLGLFQEAFFLYNFFEYATRYFFFVWPQLRRKMLVVTDRYFYDFYGQYSSAASSRILPLLLQLYPKPDCLFVLDTDVEMLMSRGKFGERRSVKSAEDLEGQRRRYLFLSKQLGGVVIHSSGISANVKTIIDRSWKKLVGS